MKAVPAALFLCAISLSSLTLAQEAVFELEPPSYAVPAGDIFEVALKVTDKSQALSAYAAKVIFDSSLLTVVDILGGNINSFDDQPLTDPQTFESGEVNFAAVSATVTSTPSSYVVARIQLRAAQVFTERAELGLAPISGQEPVYLPDHQPGDTNFAGAIDILILDLDQIIVLSDFE